MKKKYFWVNFIFFLLISFPGYAVHVPDEVSLAAETGLNPMLNAIPEGFEYYYGFENREEFENTHIGTAFRVCTISPEKLQISYRGRSYIEPLNVWRFQVICSGRTRSLLTVAEIKGEWRAVEIGAAGLAVEFETFEKTFPLGDKKKPRALLRLFQLKSDCLVVLRHSPDVEDGIFYPLQSTVMNLRTTKPPAKGLSFPELLVLLQEKVEKDRCSLPELNR